MACHLEFYARVSVIKARSYARGSVSRKRFCLSGARGSVVQQRMFHASGSVSGVDLMQVVLSSHARGSVSCKSICHLAQGTYP